MISIFVNGIFERKLVLWLYKKGNISNNKKNYKVKSINKNKWKFRTQDANQLLATNKSSTITFSYKAEWIVYSDNKRIYILSH
jgi:hypothetical protein